MKKKQMNLNDLALMITKMEEGKKQVSIAQVKEILKDLGYLLSSMNAEDAIQILNRLMKAGNK